MLYCYQHIVNDYLAPAWGNWITETIEAVSCVCATATAHNSIALKSEDILFTNIDRLIAFPRLWPDLKLAPYQALGTEWKPEVVTVSARRPSISCSPDLFTVERELMFDAWNHNVPTAKKHVLVKVVLLDICRVIGVTSGWNPSPSKRPYHPPHGRHP